MTEATSVGAIIAYLRMNRDQWRRDVRDTTDDARGLGRLNPNIRISTNAGEALAQLRAVRAASNDASRDAGRGSVQFHLLADSIALVGAAAVPVGAVATGVLAGLIPTAAAAVLGVKGITEEYKSGSLAATQYGADISTVQGWLSQLKATAANGILQGVDTAVQQSSPLFQTLNRDIGGTANQLGNIVAGAAPALLEILDQLNPLFLTFGDLLTRGADELEHWAQNSNGVTGFVSYVQAELPDVMKLLGNLVVLFAHVAQGATGAGQGALLGLNLLVKVLDDIPVDALQILIPLLIAGRAAMLGYGAVTAILNAVNGALLGLATRSAAFTAVWEANALATEAAAAGEAAAVAEAKAAEATAAAESAAAIAASTAGTGSILEAGAAAASTAAAEFAAAMALEAEAAQASAVAVSEAAATAAASVEESGALAATGWAAALGPVGALAAGVGVLGLVLFSSAHNTQANTAAMNDYTASLEQSKGAIDATVQATVAKRLADEGLIAMGAKLSLTTQDLIGYTLGNAEAQKKVNDAVQGALPGLKDQNASRDQINKNLKTAETLTGPLVKGLNSERDSLQGSTAAAKAQRDAVSASATAASAAAAQTQAYTTALQNLAQTELAAAQSEDAFREGLLNVNKTVKDNGDSLSKNTKGGLANRDMLLSLLGQAVSLANAQKKNGAGVDVVTRSLQANVAQLEKTAIAAGLPKAAVERLVAQMGLTPKQIGTKFNVDGRTAQRQIETLQTQINNIRQGKVPGLTANTAAANARIHDLQVRINSLKGTVTVDADTSAARSKISSVVDGHYTAVITVTEANGVRHGNTAAAAPAHAAGGSVADGYFTVGEEGGPHGWELGYKQGSHVEIYSNKDARAMTGLTGVPAYAAGTKTGGKTTSSELSALQSAATALLAAAGNTNATAADVRSATAQLKAAAKAAHEGAAAIAAAGRIQTQINQLGAQRAALAAHLGTAPTAPTLYERLADAQQTRSQDAGSFASGITGGFDITGAGVTTSPNVSSTSRQAGATITTTTPGTGGSAVSLGQIIGDSDAAVAQAKEYDRLLRKLAAEGLDKTELLELAGKSPADGLPVARELAKATPAQIRHLASNQNTINRTGSSLGASLAQQFDGAGVALVQGLIAGVKSQEKALDHSIEKLAERMIKKFRDKLKIKSPSRVTHEIGAFLGEGLANGMVERIPRVNAAAGLLAGAAVPNVNGPSKGAAAAGGPQIVQHIYPRAGQSEREIGRAAGDELAWALAR